jgi:hypothetical protein
MGIAWGMIVFMARIARVVAKGFPEFRGQYMHFSMYRGHVRGGRLGMQIAIDAWALHGA